jgi:hypothetical protein
MDLFSRERASYYGSIFRRSTVHVHVNDESFLRGFFEIDERLSARLFIIVFVVDAGTSAIEPSLVTPTDALTRVR